NTNNIALWDHGADTIITTKRRHLYKQKGTSTVPSINHIRSLVFAAVLITCDFLVEINPSLSCQFDE
ncbi:hypothetical protein, partial [Vibrio paracholerae]|uniref:hypothetical protein n=1 Tax=Vibrio paracholerae TaxID=650003 RepID=UPI001C67D7CC